MAKNENVIQLRSHLTPQNPSREQRYCHHPNITVVEDMRLIVCRDCQLWIEPFDFLMSWARNDWAAERVAGQHREETKLLCKEKVELKREIRNLKGKVKRLKTKVILFEQTLKG